MCFISNRYLRYDNALYGWAVINTKYTEHSKQNQYIKKAQEEYITYLKSSQKKIHSIQYSHLKSPGQKPRV